MQDPKNAHQRRNPTTTLSQISANQFLNMIMLVIPTVERQNEVQGIAAIIDEENIQKLRFILKSNVMHPATNLDMRRHHKIKKIAGGRTYGRMDKNSQNVKKDKLLAIVKSINQVQIWHLVLGWAVRIELRRVYNMYYIFGGKNISIQ